MRSKQVSTLKDHLIAVQNDKRKFENVYQSVKRMILEQGIDKVNVNGRMTYNFNIFRLKKKHIIGMYDEITSFVAFIKDAAEGGPSSEMAFVEIGEPGNGKTFFAEYVCNLYREFMRREENTRYSFRFKNLKELGLYGKYDWIDSQTFEDPMILAMNLYEEKDENVEFLEKNGFTSEKIEQIYKNYRTLGACTSYIYYDLLERKSIDDILENHIEVFPLPIRENSGILTGKYAPKDKITSSAEDLVGAQEIARLLNLSDPNNPYIYNLRKGALARVGGGGIHFSDEIFKNKEDLIKVYLGVIQNRNIEISGFKWPLDTMIIATSNIAEFNSFAQNEENAPIIDRCQICYVAHNTNYQEQLTLTGYALGDLNTKTTFFGEPMHVDPNLNYALSVASVLTRLPQDDNFDPTILMKLAAGEVAGDKSLKALRELINKLNHEPELSKRFGYTGLSQRGISRALNYLKEKPATNEGRCMYAGDVFDMLQRTVLDDPNLKQNQKAKYLDDFKIAKQLYAQRVSEALYNAYMDDKNAINKDVMNYVRMVVGMGNDVVGENKILRYRDPQTNEERELKIDSHFVDAIEKRIGLTTKEQKEHFRGEIRRVYSAHIMDDANYDFMDDQRLVKAVTDYRLKSDIHGASSLVGAISNRSNEENEKLYNRIIDVMMNKLGYCKTCALKTTEFYCENFVG